MSFETPGPVEARLRAAISPIEDIIAEARAGRMFILVDHEDRENEGDLVIPAQAADAAAINFMATHGRGLICLTLPAERIEELGLPMMAMHNSSRHETAFTVSIEAREGVTLAFPRRIVRIPWPRRLILAKALPISPRRAMSFRCGHGAVACWCGQGIPKRAVMCRVWRGTTRPR